MFLDFYSLDLREMADRKDSLVEEIEDDHMKDEESYKELNEGIHKLVPESSVVQPKKEPLLILEPAMLLLFLSFGLSCM